LCQEKEQLLEHVHLSEFSPEPGAYSAVAVHQSTNDRVAAFEIEQLYKD
jgi:hypothetical protein